MQTINFEFIKPGFAILAELGGFAERYAQPDPVSALVKLRKRQRCHAESGRS